MIRYQHSQFGWVMVIIVFLVGLSVFFVVPPLPEDRSWVYWLTLTPLFLFLPLFYRLTTVVTAQAVIVKFGIGLIKRSISLDTIQACRPLNKQFILGWGIRFGVDFTLWNVSGFKAVELIFRDKKWKFRIGTDRPDELSEAINAAIRERSPGVKKD